MPVYSIRRRTGGYRIRRVGGRRVGAARRAPVRRLGARVGRSQIGPIQPVQYFKRTDYSSGFVTANSTGDVFATYVFQLGQVPDVGDFTQLYDQYQIKMIKWSLIPRGSSSDVGTGTTTGQLMGVFSCIDYDDNTNPSSIDEIAQYQNMKMTRSNQIHKRLLRPRVRVAGISAAGTVVNTNPIAGVWCDCNNTTIPHYGIKYALQQLPNGTQTYDLKVDYYLAFKNVR